MNLIYRPKGAAAEYALWGLNHYAGCDHGCSYCYMRAMHKRYKLGDFDRPHEKKRVLELLEADCRKLTGIDQRVQLCFATDPYLRLDVETKLTRGVIVLLRKYDIPFQVLTKGGRYAARDFDLYGPDDLFGVTLTRMDECWLTYYEPMAGTLHERLASLQAAHARGIKTWVSLEPVICAGEALRIIEQTAGFVDLYKIGALTGMKNPGVDYAAFAANAVAVCRRLGGKYYLKESLARYLDESAYENTDWRVVIRWKRKLNITRSP